MIYDFCGPFLGFRFCGEHSSNFKIVRINSGDKGELPLTPEFNDITVERVGADGSYYFDTQNKTVSFTVDFAFDDINETEMRALRNFLNSKKVGPLIFDETPYKQYNAKVAQQIKLNYIAFEEDLMEDGVHKIQTKTELYGPNFTEHTGRIYKGEGSVNFIAYSPYAKAPFQTIEEYIPDYINYGYNNFDEWRESSQILGEEQYKLYNNNIVNGQKSLLYNAGDLNSPIDFDFIYTGSNKKNKYVEFDIIKNEENVGSIIIDLNLLEIGQTYHFNSEKKLIVNQDGLSVNGAIICGDFLFVPVGDGAQLTCTLFEEQNVNTTLRELQLDIPGIDKDTPVIAVLSTINYDSVEEALVVENGFTIANEVLEYDQYLIDNNIDTTSDLSITNIKYDYLYL